MKNKKISVIVPCYNVEKYIDKCMECLINQTYKNIEIIAVEDCSTDNTKKNLKKYANYKNVKIIYNKKNSGLSYSRNIGLKNATGDYIGYIDSDDYVDLEYYERLMNSIVKNKSEIAICDMKIVDCENNTENISKCCNFDEFNLINIINNGLVASACNKLFKKELITKYEFQVGKVNEDLAVVIPTLCEAKKISYAKNCYYYYVQRNGSIQNSSFSNKRFDIFSGVDLTLERIKENKDYEELKQAIIYNQIIVLLIYVIPKEKNAHRRKEILKRYNELSNKYKIRQNHYFWHFLEQCGKKHRLYYKLLFKLNCTGHYNLSNTLISLYNFYSKKLKSQGVIPFHVDIYDVVEAAKYQSNLKKENIKVSVVVPNYNYARFMYQRLYSILKQNYRIEEIIVLDDCSKDDSKEVIDEIVKNIKEYVNIRTIYNTKNSGSAFKQWQKGFDEAKGDYIWIAEADDYCEENLIKSLVKPIKKNKNIIISYADTAFIDASGNIILKSIKPEIDIQKSGHWDHSYINDGLNEIKNYSYLNCTIANVSSCIIKKDNYTEYFKQSGEFKQAGDWLFYVNIMRKGFIAYNKKVLNYYRVHGNNVSSTMNRQKHIDEINKIHSYYLKEFKLGAEHKRKMKERIDFLKNVWKLK